MHENTDEAIAWTLFEALNRMMFAMSSEDHAVFVDENNRVAQLFMVFTAVADYLMRWGPLENAGNRPAGQNDLVMRQTVYQRAVVKLLWKTADGLPLKYYQCKVAVRRLADDLAINVALSRSSPTQSPSGEERAVGGRGQ